jgi:uncharacterized protein YqhQ
VSDRIRLGGMALANGVLVHGPTSWACAVRLEDGTLKVAARRKRLQAMKITNPILRGPARMAEAMSLLPLVKRALPEAQLPFERRSVLAAMAGTFVAGSAVRKSSLRPAARELLTNLMSLAPAVMSLRGGDVASYHGAEHIAIGTYEHGESRPKEHERCGSHLVGPMIVTSAAAGIAAEHLPQRHRAMGRAAGALGALAASTEIFGWMARNPAHPLAKALARPGHELQHRVGTDDPSPEQLEVAEAALNACLELERDHDA